MGSDSICLFAFRLLNDQEKKYSTNELELHAIVRSCDYFRNYLLDNHFEVLTDHKAIISSLKTNRGSKTHQSRLTRWESQLLSFDFEVIQIFRSKLGIVDLLTRFLTFEAALPTSFDEHYVVNCFKRFFGLCDLLAAGFISFQLQINRRVLRRVPGRRLAIIKTIFRIQSFLLIQFPFLISSMLGTYHPKRFKAMNQILVLIVFVEWTLTYPPFSVNF